VLQLGAADHDRTESLPVGETVRVTLGENASTGYRWAIDRCDEHIFEVLGSQSSYPGVGVGSAGEVSFSFRGRQVGSGTIVLKQWRAWEGDASVIDRLALHLNVHA
jgi:inhibitor of cysteine peptidase